MSAVCNDWIHFAFAGYFGGKVFGAHMLVRQFRILLGSVWNFDREDLDSYFGDEVFGTAIV